MIYFKLYILKQVLRIGKYLNKLAPFDLTGVAEEEEEPYSSESAEVLMKNSSDFDSFVSSTLDDVENFTKSN